MPRLTPCLRIKWKIKMPIRWLHVVVTATCNCYMQLLHAAVTDHDSVKRVPTSHMFRHGGITNND